LDELNLAPSDVLEALNRVLDDNRELFIPETQQKIHNSIHLKNIMFSQQILSRAFKNRFVELHFDQIPPDELETIFGKICQIPPSYCEKIIKVMTDLQRKRKNTAAFAGKKGTR